MKYRYVLTEHWPYDSAVVLGTVPDMSEQTILGVTEWLNSKGNRDYVPRVIEANDEMYLPRRMVQWDNSLGVMGKFFSLVETEDIPLGSSQVSG